MEQKTFMLSSTMRSICTWSFHWEVVILRSHLIWILCLSFVINKETSSLGLVFFFLSASLKFLLGTSTRSKPYHSEHVHSLLCLPVNSPLINFLLTFGRSNWSYMSSSGSVPSNSFEQLYSQITEDYKCSPVEPLSTL